MTVKILFVVVVSRFLKSLPKKKKNSCFRNDDRRSGGRGWKEFDFFFLRILMTIKMLVTFRDSFGDLV